MIVVMDIIGVFAILFTCMLVIAFVLWWFDRL